jgi:uncharacterized membrane protein YoaK (UPF0700 family)
LSKDAVNRLLPLLRRRSEWSRRFLETRLSRETWIEGAFSLWVVAFLGAVVGAVAAADAGAAIIACVCVLLVVAWFLLSWVKRL